MRSRSAFHLICVLLLFISYVSSVFSQGEKREIQWADYPYPTSDTFKEKLKFGYIIVPETRNSTNPRELKIAFCILKGSHQKELDNPILFLPGGPGGGMTRAAAYYESPSNHWKKRLEFTDIVFFDPRGCGKSEPDLCPAMDDPEFQYASLIGKTEEEINREIVRVLTACSDSLSAENVDVNAYGSDEIAEDIEDLRISLGVKQWNIQGGSYGTRYAQGLIRNFPNSVRSAFLFGLVPTTRNYEDDALRSFSRSLQLILKECNQDLDCNTTYPDLENKLFEALEYYNENPLVIAPEEQKLIENHHVIIDGSIIAQGIFQLAYGPVGIEIIPAVIQAVADRKDWIIKNFVNSIGDMFSGNSDMNLIINANDNPEYGLSTDIASYDSFTKNLMPYFQSQDILSEGEQASYLGIQQDSLQEVPISSTIPIIMQTGIFDPITPPANTRIASTYLTNSIALAFPENSHWSRENICFSNMLTDFYRTARIPEDAEACFKDSKPIAFVSDISYNKGIADIGSTLLMGKELQVYIPLAIGLLFVLIGFLGIPLYSLIGYSKQRRNKHSDKNKSPWLPWAITLMVVLFVGFLYFGITASLEKNMYILGFGILSSWNWVFWLGYIILGLLIFAIFKRKLVLEKNMTKVGKALAFISWCGGLVFICVILYWNLLWPFSNT